MYYSWGREEIHRKLLSEDVNEEDNLRDVFSDGVDWIQLVWAKYHC
jgi:hypothetical protein